MEFSGARIARLWEKDRACDALSFKVFQKDLPLGAIEPMSAGLCDNCRRFGYIKPSLRTVSSSLILADIDMIKDKLKI